MNMKLPNEKPERKKVSIAIKERTWQFKFFIFAILYAFIIVYYEVFWCLAWLEQWFDSVTVYCMYSSCCLLTMVVFDCWKVPERSRMIELMFVIIWWVWNIIVIRSILLLATKNIIMKHLIFIPIDLQSLLLVQSVTYTDTITNRSS